jgi:two-component system response regulator FixJ
MLRDALWNCRFATEVFATPDQCLQSLGTHRYDLVLVDCGGDTSGALELVTKAQQMARQTPAVLFVERGDVRAAVRAIKAGATDCVEKPIEATRLIPALNAVLGQTEFRSPDGGMVLTKTEDIVLHAILEGGTNREIADLLHRSRRTVEVHRRNIMRKLGATTVVSLVRRSMSLAQLCSRTQRIGDSA